MSGRKNRDGRASVADARSAQDREARGVADLPHAAHAGGVAEAMTGYGLGCGAVWPRVRPTATSSTCPQIRNAQAVLPQLACAPLRSNVEGTDRSFRAVHRGHHRQAGLAAPRWCPRRDRRARLRVRCSSRRRRPDPTRPFRLAGQSLRRSATPAALLLMTDPLRASNAPRALGGEVIPRPGLTGSLGGHSMRERYRSPELQGSASRTSTIGPHGTRARAHGRPARHRQRARSGPCGQRYLPFRILERVRSSRVTPAWRARRAQSTRFSEPQRAS